MQNIFYSCDHPAEVVIKNSESVTFAPGEQLFPTASAWRMRTLDLHPVRASVVGNVLLHWLEAKGLLKTAEAGPPPDLSLSD
jgi:hypothetical protein